ncbi:MAG TPA: hypothetical protein VD815_08325 [Candidatus Saccharimonadales bacterium]|nr:hypothetical protein [Candidatus Saccharimonadales bacterium]
MNEIVNDQDNCPMLSNADQLYSDADGIDNMCDNEDNPFAYRQISFNINKLG